MAKTNKIGLDYFPLDVKFFGDDKIALIESEFGIKGLVICLKLLCKIYQNEGYYCQWGDDECKLFAKNAGGDFAPSLVNEVVNGLVRRCFFDKKCYGQFNILTSAGIQKRYYDATNRYKKVEFIKEYLLIDDVNRKNVCIYGINDDTNRINVDTNPHNVNENESINVNGSDNEKGTSSPSTFFNPPAKGFLTIDECAKKAFASQPFIEVYYRWGLDRDKLRGWMRAFNRYLKYQDEEFKQEADYRKHFGNWLKYQTYSTTNPDDYTPAAMPEKTAEQQDLSPATQQLRDRIKQQNGNQR